MVAVGRGGRGDVGQQIRDEILVIQSQNSAKVSENLLVSAFIPSLRGPVSPSGM